MYAIARVSLHMQCYAMLCHAMPCHAMPSTALPCHTMPCHVMPFHAMSCHAMSCYAMPCHAMSRSVMSRHVISCNVTSYHGNNRTMSCHVMSCHVMPGRATSRRVASCHASIVSSHRISLRSLHAESLYLKHNIVVEDNCRLHNKNHALVCVVWVSVKLAVFEEQQHCSFTLRSSLDPGSGNVGPGSGRVHMGMYIQAHQLYFQTETLI